MATTPANFPTAADLMTAAPRTCSPFSSVMEAVMIFRDADCGAVPVVDEGVAVGLITDRDVALALADHPDDLTNLAVADLMTRDVVTITADSGVEAIAACFGQHGVRRLLVTDGDQLVGIIAWSDLAAYLPNQKLGQIVNDIVEQP
jgi:CBS domain-containing protein